MLRMLVSRVSFRPQVIAPLVILAFFSFALSCGNPARKKSVPTVPAPTAPIAADERVVMLSIHASPEALPSMGSGALVTWWDIDEDPEGRFAQISIDLARFVVTKVSDFPAAGLKLSLVVPNSATRLHVFYDNMGVFFPAYLGGAVLPRANVDVSEAGPGASLTILLKGPGDNDPNAGARGRQAFDDDPGSPCTSEGLQRIEVELPAIVGRTDADAKRVLCARVPPSYLKNPAKRYPVLYLLPGLGSRSDVYMRGDGSIGKLVDELGLELIVVGIDTSTPAGSAYFTNNEVGGMWLDAFDLMVAAVDKTLRTQSTPSCRYLMGQSTGGFNSVHLMLKRPEAFAAAVASAPDGLDLQHWLFEAGEKRLKPRWLQWMNFEERLASAVFPNFGQFISYAVSWSPRPDAAMPFQMPATQSGEIDESAWAQWREHSPIVVLADPSKKELYTRALADKFLIAVSSDDEFDLFESAKRFSQKLQSMGIAHEFVASEGGHGNRNERFKKGLEFIGAKECVRALP